MHQSRSQEQRVRGELLSTIKSLNTSQFTPQFVQPAPANVHVSSCVQLIHDFLYHGLSMSDEGLQCWRWKPVIIFHIHVSKHSRYKKHYLVMYSPRSTWKLELGVQVQVTVSSLQSHSSRLQRSSRPLYTLARAATTTTSTNTAVSRDMAPRQPHHCTTTIMALTAPGASCCCVRSLCCG